MKVYRRSGLIEDLLILLSGFDSLKKDIDKTREEMEKIDSKAGEAFDKVVDKVLNAGVSELSAARDAAKRGVRKALLESIDAIMYPMDQLLKKTEGMFSFSDLLSVMSNEEDILSIKATTIKADMYLARSQNPMQRPPVYGTTVDGINDAVFNYYNAPRAENATHIALFCAVPTGIHRYLVRQMLYLRKLASDPIYKGIGLESLSSKEGFMGAVDRVTEYLMDGLNEALFKEKELLLTQPVLKRADPASAVFKKRTEAEKINSYRWYIESELSANPVLPVKTEHKRMVRFSVAGDIDNRLTLTDEQKYTDYYVSEGIMAPESGRTSRPRLFSTQLTGGMKKASLRMDIIGEIFKADKPYDVFRVFSETGAALMIEYWDYTFDTDGKLVLTALDDMRVIDMSISFAGESGSWYGLSAGGLGSMLPSLDEFSDQIRKMLEEIVKSAIRLDELGQSAISELVNMMLATIRRAAELLQALFTIFVLILKVVFAFDIRYALFHGSYTDIPIIWRMVRGDYKLVEAMGNSVFALIVTAKGDYFSKVEEAFNAKVRLAAGKIGENRKHIPVIPVSQSAVPENTAPDLFVPPVIGAPDIPQDEPDIIAAGSLQTNIFMAAGKKQRMTGSGGMFSINIPAYKGT